MRVFKISGKTERSGNWSEKEFDFEGYFMKEDYSDVLIGYLIEPLEAFDDSIRYIKGLYNKELNRLVFLKMSNERDLFPSVYAFSDLEENGLWFGYSLFLCGFSIPDGYAKVKVEEVNIDMDLERKISKTYHHVLDVGRKVNIELLAEDIDDYVHFFDISKD